MARCFPWSAVGPQLAVALVLCDVRRQHVVQPSVCCSEWLTYKLGCCARVHVGACIAARASAEAQSRTLMTCPRIARGAWQQPMAPHEALSQTEDRGVWGKLSRGCQGTTFTAARLRHTGRVSQTRSEKSLCVLTGVLIYVLMCAHLRARLYARLSSLVCSPVRSCVCAPADADGVRVRPVLPGGPVFP